MKQPFNANFFAGNRQRLLATLPGGSEVPLVVTANGLVQRGADSPYAFMQDANFWYLTGIDEPDITLVMDGGREFLIAPQREGIRATFDGAVDFRHLARASGIREILNEAAGWKRLDELLKKSGKVATLAAAPSYIEQYGMYANPARLRLNERLEQHVPDLEYVDIRMELARLRMIKQPAELAAIQKAIDITTASLNEALARPRERAGRYHYEYQLEAAVAAGFRRRGAAGQAFEPIVAGGRRACTLHNVSNQSRLRPGELVVIDVGAEYQHYAADLTRTIALSKPSPRQKEVYAAVQAVQTEAKALLGPGVNLKTYENKVAKIMARQLQQLGLIKLQKEVRRYFPHATSHFMGLNVHDVGDYRQPLTAGAVITVEPGIYIPEEAVGIRLEDDVLITDSGIKNLSAGLPQRLF